MSFDCTDKDTLLAYIYGECDAATRGLVDAHLAACPGCADEVAGFGMVRESLSQWSPPGRVGSYRLVLEEDAAAPAPAKVLRPARWWQAPVSTLAKVAAGVLLFAGGAALANLEIRYDGDGFVVRTGWQQPAAQVATAPAPAQTTQPVSLVQAAPAARPAADPSPWRSDLASVEQQLRDVRQQLATVKAASAPVAARVPTQVAGNVSLDENRLMERVYSALDESERRQQLNVATYMSRFASDLQAGRSFDMRRIGIELPPALPQQRQKNVNLFDVSLGKK